MEADHVNPYRMEGDASDLVRERYVMGRRGPRIALGILFLFLLFEYLRLHQILPILGMMKVQTVTSAALLLVVIAETAKGGVRLARQSWYLLGFLGLIVFTIFIARNQFYAYQFAYGLALILIGYFAITHFLQNEKDLKRFLSLLVGIHIFLSIKGIMGYSRSQFDEKGFASTGTVGGSFLGDENDVALAMILILPFAIYLFHQARSLAGRIFWGGGSVVILLTIIFTFSRGGIVGLGAMVLYWIMTSEKKGKAVATLVLAGALVIAVAPSEYWKRVATITDIDSGTALKRRNNWAAARRMFVDSPIWGVGGYNFAALHPEYAVEYSEEKRPTRWGRVSHSMYFDLLAEFGLLGVLLIGSVLIANFRDLRQVDTLNRMGRSPPSIAKLAHSLRISWVGFLVPAAFLSVLAYPHLYYLTALTVVVHKLGFAESEYMETEELSASESER